MVANRKLPWATIAALALCLPVSGPGRPLWVEPTTPTLSRLLAFLPPVDGGVISNYGSRRGEDQKWRRHQGVDLHSPYGALVHSTASGTVVAAGETSGYGQNVVIEHADGITTLYAHLSVIAVKPGQFVRAGQSLGRVGETGHATGPHLHFEIRWNGHQIDPAPILNSQRVRSVSLRIPVH